jgi:hypothetical protein
MKSLSEIYGIGCICPSEIAPNGRKSAKMRVGMSFAVSKEKKENVL